MSGRGYGSVTTYQNDDIVAVRNNQVNVNLEVGEIRETGHTVYVNSTYAARYNFAVKQYNYLADDGEEKKRDMRGGRFLLYNVVAVIFYIGSIICNVQSDQIKSLLAVPVVISTIYVFITCYNWHIYRKNGSLIHERMFRVEDHLLPHSKNKHFTIPLNANIQNRELIAATDGSTTAIVARLRQRYVNVTEIDIMISMSFRKFSDDHSTQDFLCHFCNERLPTLDDMRTHLEICATKTKRCPYCQKHIQLSIYIYHTDNNCTNPDLSDVGTRITTKDSTNRRTETEISKKLEPLLEKATRIHETLAEICYESEVDHVAENFQFNIVIMGSPRVGKSTLINTLCGENVAETSSSLNPCTSNIKCHTLKYNQKQNSNTKPFKINFWDTPGIESWDKQEGQNKMIEFIEKTKPICVIYCASPGSTAKLDQLHSVLEYCKGKDIFCALVCTNMWTDSKRNIVISEFEKQLTFFGEKIDKFSIQPEYRKAHKITFFGTGALCTMVNSMKYYDAELSDREMPVQGVDELIHGIMEALDQEKLLGWCYAVLHQRSYWEKISQNIGGFFKLRFTNLYNLISLSTEGTAYNFLAHFFNQSIFGKKN